MKLIRFSFLLSVSILLYSCHSESTANGNSEDFEQMVTTMQKKTENELKEVQTYVTENFKNSRDSLFIADSLQDSTGLFMALILDTVLKKGYMPDSFEQKKGFRVYFYHKQEEQ